MKILTPFIVAGALLFTLAPSASAHHANISGEVKCLDNGTQRITWTISNSETVVSEGGNGRTMVLDYIHISEGTVGWKVDDEFPARPLDGSIQSKITDLPGDLVGGVALEIRADWEDGPQNVEASTSVQLDGECEAVTTTTTTTTAPSTTTTTTTVPEGTTTTIASTTTTTVRTSTTTAPTSTTTIPIMTLPTTTVGPITQDFPTEVKKETTLPRTGGDSLPLALYGGAAIGLGVVALTARRNR